MPDAFQATLFDSDGDNTAQTMKAGMGRLHFLEVSNINAADAYLQLFDVLAANVTVGTTTPKMTLLVPKGDGANRGAMDVTFDPPVNFDVGITYACTTTATGNGDPTTGLVVNAGYV